MRNRTLGQSTSTRRSNIKIGASGEPLPTAQNEGQSIKSPLDISETIISSRMLDPRSTKSNGRIRTLQHAEETYQSAYEAGLASGNRAGYRRGYREGFADACKLGGPANGVTAAQNTSNIATSTVAPKNSAVNRVSRLRGLPCANCGCSFYSDEVQCPCCGTPKAPARSA